MKPIETNDLENTTGGYYPPYYRFAPSPYTPARAHGPAAWAGYGPSAWWGAPPPAYLPAYRSAAYRPGWWW